MTAASNSEARKRLAESVAVESVRLSDDEREVLHGQMAAWEKAMPYNWLGLEYGLSDGIWTRLDAAVERILAARIEQARAEGAAEVVARIAGAAVVAYKGPLDTDADIMRITARDLRGGYDIGGSNRRAAVARVLDVVADAMDGAR